MTRLGWKVCNECHRDLLATKFYTHTGEPDGLMKHCKACHNGLTDRIEQERVVALERQWGDPSEEQIARAAAVIRQRWDAKTLVRRKKMSWLSRGKKA